MTPSSNPPFRSLRLAILLGSLAAGCATVRMDRQLLGPAAVYQRTAVYCVAQTAEGRRQAESIFRDALQIQQIGPGRVADTVEVLTTAEDLVNQLKSAGFDSLLLVGRHSMVQNEPHEAWQSALVVPSTAGPLAVSSVVDSSSYRTALEAPAARDSQNVARAQDLTVPAGRRYVSGHSWLVDLSTGKAVWSAHGTVSVPESERSKKSLGAAATALVEALVEDGFLQRR